MNANGLVAEQETLNGPFIPGNSVLSAFEVDGIETPEPASFFLVAVGLAFLGRRTLNSLPFSAVSSSPLIAEA